jgi:class 3 adenylate cyclase/pimeloyl-ACP methyl ester carboxylesterase
MRVQTSYALSDGAHIAYQVVGEGPIDLLLMSSFLSNIELSWEHPGMAAFTRRLARFGRLILFDRRGNGMSDRAGGPLPLEDQVDDVRAVLDAAGAQRPALLAVNEGARLALLFAASHPEAVSALVLAAPVPRLVRGPGYEWAQTVQERERSVAALVASWGRDEPGNTWLGMGGDDPARRAAMARYQRLASGPGDAGETLRAAADSDVRSVLGTIQCPTLVLRRADDAEIDERHSRCVADGIPGARYVEVAGTGQVWAGDPEQPCTEIEAFLTGMRPRPPAASERVLATVLFTDIVSSTERASQLGDARWRELLRSHDAIVADEVQRHRGRVVKSLGDGAMAVFDGPSRAVGCALALGHALAPLGLSVRAGLHTGECELLDGGDVGGIAVHIAARISALAGAGEVLVSGTVRDLSVGSPFALSSRGEQSLKGVAEPWRVYAASA